MKITLTALALTAAVGLAACGGSSDNNGAATAATSRHRLVVEHQRRERPGRLEGRRPLHQRPGEERHDRCTDGCTSIWPPLTAPRASRPPASDVSGDLGVVKRPDGARQVTLDGTPLYRFAQDGGPGKVNGDGVTDSFGGQQFTLARREHGKSSSSSARARAAAAAATATTAHAEGRARQQRVAVVEEQPRHVAARLELRVEVALARSSACRAAARRGS